MAAPASEGMPTTCAGCGVLAPPNVDVASSSGEEKAGAILRWCVSCRARVAATPQPVPHYTAFGELGRGAMWVLYQARHNQTGRMVALMVIVAESAAARSIVEGFMREVTDMGQVTSPLIGALLEQGTARGKLWFAKAYVADSLNHSRLGINSETLI